MAYSLGYGSKESKVCVTIKLFRKRSEEEESNSDNPTTVNPIYELWVKNEKQNGSDDRDSGEQTVHISIMITTYCVRKTPTDTMTETSEMKPTVVGSIKLFLNRLFRRSTNSKDQDSASNAERPSLIGCSRSQIANELGNPVVLPDSTASLISSSWKLSCSVPQPSEMPPTFNPEYLAKQTPCEAWLPGYELQRQLLFPQAVGRFLQCPFCLQVAGEFDFQSVIADAVCNTRFLPSHSAQTFCEFDESHTGAPEYTNYINPLHGSMMTDSGISIESDKMSPAILTSLMSAARSPSPQKTPTCFHLSSEPPPSPAPPPVSLLSPMTPYDIPQSRTKHCQNASGGKLDIDEKNDKWKQTSEKYSDLPSPDAKQFGEMYQLKADIEITMNSESFLHAGGLIANTDDQGGSSVTPSINVDDVFSSDAIQDAIDSETRTRLIQSRTREQIKSLLQLSLGTKVDPLFQVEYNRNDDARLQLHNELAILEDAKNVINHQIEELKKQYSHILRGKLSLPVVESLECGIIHSEANVSKGYQASPVCFIRERSYSLDDLRFTAF
ncbi:hypothetical protein D915_000392 [Fasciola hepatica]|uniref:Uncharacterized protein n=1 Tax=Fasciola hepatica TaxID=6192 RepID=A0A4E0RK93_FASHE|nr:hypothetical protein D915_000392 [Fasciola hepatica]